MLEQFQALARTIGILDVIDTGLVAFFLYRIYIMLKNTRAAALVKGLMVLAALVIVSKWLNLHVINWILEKAMTMMMVALPVVFQPELRRALEQIGRGRLFRKRVELDEAELNDMIEAVANAAVIMGQRKVGALIVFERAVGLEERIETGIKIDGLVTDSLLLNIFEKDSGYRYFRTVGCAGSSGQRGNRYGLCYQEWRNLPLPAAGRCCRHVTVCFCGEQSFYAETDDFGEAG